MFLMRSAGLLQKLKKRKVVEVFYLSVAHVNPNSILTCPRPGHCGHESMSHSTVVGLADRADKAIADFPPPGPAHAFACMAAIALAPGFSVEYGSSYL